MESGNDIGIIEIYVIKRYADELKEVCPEKIFKDVSIEITHDKGFPNRIDTIVVIFRYKNDIVMTKPYCLRDNFPFNYDVDAKNFLQAFKNKVFKDYCDKLED